MATLINQSFFTFGDITGGGGEPFDYFVLRSDGEWSPCVCRNVPDAHGVNWSSDSNTGFYQVSDMANLHYTMNVNSKTGSLVAVSVT